MSQQPDYVTKNLRKFEHNSPTKPQHTPLTAAPKVYGKKAQEPTPLDTSPTVDVKAKKRIEQIV